MELSNKAEVAIVTTLGVCGTAATWITQQAWIPDNVKIPLAGTLGGIAIVGGIWWAKFVEACKQ